MSRQEPILEIERVTLRYGVTLAVDDLTLAVADREIVALVGPSGCGKTSLLRVIAGFERPEAGSVRIGGVAVTGEADWTPPERRRVGMVFQQGALFPHMTVTQNVRYGVDDRADATHRAEAALDLVGMAEHGERYPDQLSGGQQQRVALARALAPAPRIVLLDEPFANLDAGLRDRLRADVRRILNAARATAVFVTHDQEEALSLADRVAVMKQGELLQMGTAEEIYERPASIDVAEFIGGGQLFDGSTYGGRLESVFGPMQTDAPDGRCRLLVRSEDLTVLPAWAGAGTKGQLVGRAFFGHHEILTVRLEGGSTVLVRRLVTPDREFASEIQLALCPKRYRVFVENAGVFEASSPSGEVPSRRATDRRPNRD